MSRRTTDWSPLAVSSDPVPGDPDEIERAARSLADVAEEITRQAANLRKLSTAEGWDADAGRTFADSARELAGQLSKTHGRYATAAGALRRYAPELRYAQSVADAALAEAKIAQGTIDANRPPAYLPTPEEASAERHRQYAYDEGVSALRAAHRKLDEATQHRDEHAGRATSAIRESIEGDGLKDSRWDRFKHWVHEHADLLTAIAKIAEVVATVLSTIALLISWIPVLDFLAPVLLGLAALASGVALVCNLMLALAGEGSWLDVAGDLFAVVTLGFGAKAGLALRAGEAAESAAGRDTATLFRAGKPGGSGPKIPMQMKNVRDVADRWGVDLKGIRVEINKSRAGVAGITGPDQKITLCRDAFKNEEQLARTLAHERFHVEQLRSGLPHPKTDEATDLFEKDAYDFEDQWWNNHPLNR